MINDIDDYFLRHAFRIVCIEKQISLNADILQRTKNGVVIDTMRRENLRLRYKLNYSKKVLENIYYGKGS